MFWDVPECSGMFHVPAFIDDLRTQGWPKLPGRSTEVYDEFGSLHSNSAGKEKGSLGLRTNPTAIFRIFCSINANIMGKATRRKLSGVSTINR